MLEVSQLPPNLRLRVGDHIVDVAALCVETRTETPRLSVKEMALLIELVRHRGETITRTRLLKDVWGEERKAPDILIRVAINRLRRAFCDVQKTPKYIETVPCVGYRLIAPVQLLPAQASPILASIPRSRSANDVDLTN